MLKRFGKKIWVDINFTNVQLQVRGYRLHAVMVHEGDANQGHYWAYVNHVERGWLKFNDNTVSQTSWSEISKEAVGGKSTSAYSLVYVDVAKDNLFSETSVKARKKYGKILCSFIHQHLSI